MSPRLQSKIWISAYIRQCTVKTVPAAVVAKGDETAGAILLRVNRLDGTSRVFGVVYGPDGERRWETVTAEDPCADETADAYIDRSRQRDPDLWVVEIENRSGDPMIDGIGV